MNAQMICWPGWNVMPGWNQRWTPENVRGKQVMLWLAMLVSVAMYFVVVSMLPPATPTENPALVNGLLVAALGMVAASFAAKARLSQAAGTDDLKRKQMGLVVPLAMCESAAVLGVVVWFVTGSPRYSWFLVIGIAGILLHYPKR